MTRTLSHLLQALLLALLWAFFRLLPLDVASALGGQIGKRLGPRWRKLHHIAEVNLALAFPEMSDVERHTIRLGMWEHLGRVFAEMAHLKRLALQRRIQLVGAEHLPPSDTPVLFISAHLGQWELCGPMAYAQGRPLALIYRHANNPYVERLLLNRRSAYAVDLIPKGPKGAAKLAHALRKKHSFGLLIDQKMNEGLPIPLFGHAAMTAPAVAHLAKRFRLPIIPARVIRTHGAHFTAVLEAPIPLPQTSDEEADTRTLLTHINARLESWIRETPEQWFWIHRRWEKERYRR